MSDRTGIEEREPKDLPEDATPRERLRFLKELAIFHKTMFGDISYNEMQAFIDKIVKVCNDSRN